MYCVLLLIRSVALLIRSVALLHESRPIFSLGGQGLGLILQFPRLQTAWEAEMAHVLMGDEKEGRKKQNVRLLGTDHGDRQLDEVPCLSDKPGPPEHGAACSHISLFSSQHFT